MRKSVQFGMAALCFALTLASVADTVSAAPATGKNAERSVANWYWSDRDEVWPPAAGRYERKNENGVTNAYINVTVLPDQWPVITLHACDYDGTDDNKGWEALSQAPAVVLARILLRKRNILKPARNLSSSAWAPSLPLAPKSRGSIGETGLGPFWMMYRLI